MLYIMQESVLPASTCGSMFGLIIWTNPKNANISILRPDFTIHDYLKIKSNREIHE